MPALTLAAHFSAPGYGWSTISVWHNIVPDRDRLGQVQYVPMTKWDGGRWRMISIGTRRHFSRGFVLHRAQDILEDSGWRWSKVTTVKDTLTCCFSRDPRTNCVHLCSAPKGTGTVKGAVGQIFNSSTERQQQKAEESQDFGTKQPKEPQHPLPLCHLPPYISLSFKSAAFVHLWLTGKMDEPIPLSGTDALLGQKTAKHLNGLEMVSQAHSQPEYIFSQPACLAMYFLTNHTLICIDNMVWVNTLSWLAGKCALKPCVEHVVWLKMNHF